MGQVGDVEQIDGRGPAQGSAEPGEPMREVFRRKQGGGSVGVAGQRDDRIYRTAATQTADLGEPCFSGHAIGVVGIEQHCVGGELKTCRDETRGQTLDRRLIAGNQDPALAVAPAAAVAVFERARERCRARPKFVDVGVVGRGISSDASFG